MPANCLTVSYAPSVYDFTDLFAGFSLPFEFSFSSAVDGSAINIMSDTFELNVYDSLGALVETMTVGTGLTPVSGGILQGIFSSPTTDDAGRYTYLLIWNITDTGARIPAVSGKITVKNA